MGNSRRLPPDEIAWRDCQVPLTGIASTRIREPVNSRTSELPPRIPTPTICRRHIQGRRPKVRLTRIRKTPEKSWNPTKRSAPSHCPVNISDVTIPGSVSGDVDVAAAVDHTSLCLRPPLPFRVITMARCERRAATRPAMACLGAMERRFCGARASRGAVGVHDTRRAPRTRRAGGRFHAWPSTQQSGGLAPIALVWPSRIRDPTRHCFLQSNRAAGRRSIHVAS